MALSWIEIDLAALRHNFEQARRRVGPRTEVMPVVKSDAYGHGMVESARVLEGAGARFFAVSKFWEAMKLRQHGVRAAVVVLLGVEPDEMEEAVRNKVRPVICRFDHARALDQAAETIGVRAPFHLKVDTGMGRLGVPQPQLASFLDRLQSLANLELEGVLTHFAVADEADKAFTEEQLRRFVQVLEQLEQRNIEVPYAHAANSAAVLDLPHAHYQLVRPGIMLYGSSPSDEILRPADLKPVMTVKTRILQLKEVPAGTSIGYGRTYTTARPAVIATLPVGYDDGYLRCLSNRSQVLVRGRRAPLVGRVSMNMITIDVSGIENVSLDDEVVLLGTQGDQRISADELARLAGTINYEIHCLLGRIPFKVFKGIEA